MSRDYKIIHDPLAITVDKCPQHFWHQGLVSWTIFPWTRVGRVVSGWLSTLYSLYTLFLFVAISGYSALTLKLVFTSLWESKAITDLIEGGAQVVMQAMASSCKYSWSISSTPAIQLPLCSLVPNRPWTSRWPGSWRSLVYNIHTKKSTKLSTLLWISEEFIQLWYSFL